MRNLRFWQKTYLFTLFLFLGALFSGVFFMGWQNQRQTMNNEVQKAKSEQHFIAQRLEKDLLAIQNNIHFSSN